MTAALAVARVLAWLALVGLTAAMSLEILFQYRVAMKLAYQPPSRRDDLRRAYFPFTVQHLHPQYFFFFPLDPEARLALGNAVCSIDRDGFREPGPAHASGRKLAVMLGGSAAFGDYASSNQATITSQLNRLQDEYFFVNAGVPSWNSSQEAQRLLFQIAGMRPALVIAYDGANDSALAGLSSPRTRLVYPPGTPESFDDLEAWVDDVRAEHWWFRTPPLFPELRHRIDKYREAMRDDDDTSTGPTGVAPAAHAYLANHQRMATLSRAAGARFVSVFQPMAGLHRNVPASWGDDGSIGSFHDVVVQAKDRGYEFYDLARLFDAHFTAIPVAEPDISSDTIFVDEVHVYDRGAEIIARRLLEIVRTPPR